MRKQKKRLVRSITALILAICFFIPAFSEAIAVSAEEIERAAPVDLITLNKNYLVLTINGVQTVTAEHSGTSGSTSVVSWSTADSSIATVSPPSGNTVTVTARKSGFTTLTAYKGSRSVSIPVYVVKSGLSGEKNYLQNMQTERVATIEGHSTSTGANIEQRDFLNASYNRWIIESVGNYYTIKSEYSGKYLGVSSTSSGASVKQYADCSSDNSKWVITATPGGYHRFIPVSCLKSGYSLAVPSGQNSNGTDLYIYSYTNDSDRRDEWFASNGFGNQEYRECNSTDINCHGYALRTNNWPGKNGVDTGWCFLAYARVGNLTLADLSSEDINERRIQFSNDMFNCFTQWLNDSWSGTWTYESDFSGNGENRLLKPNQYRVVLRTGINRYYDIEGSQYKATADYHFWYQTSNGRWANKHGQAASQYLDDGVTPFTNSSDGWKLNLNEQFYTEEIYSFILTIN